MAKNDFAVWGRIFGCGGKCMKVQVILSHKHLAILNTKDQKKTNCPKPFSCFSTDTEILFLVFFFHFFQNLFLIKDSVLNGCSWLSLVSGLWRFV